MDLTIELFLLIAVVYGSVGESISQLRIQGGINSANKHGASILIQQPGHSGGFVFCSATLVKDCPNSREKVFATAAHCLFEKDIKTESYFVIYGQRDNNVKTCENENECFSCEITSMDICPHYDETDLTGDVAFLTCVTKDIIPPNDKAEAIEICNDEEIENANRKTGEVHGFGYTKVGATETSNYQQTMNVRINHQCNGQCDRWLGRNNANEFTCVSTGRYGSGILQGDSGGPLIIEGNNRKKCLGGFASHISNPETSICYAQKYLKANSKKCKTFIDDYKNNKLKC